MAAPDPSACPRCASTNTRVLADMSQLARVWYHRCGNCGHTWTVDKDSESFIKDRVSAHLDGKY